MSDAVSPSDTVFQVLAHDHRDLEARFATIERLTTTNFENARQRYPELATALVAHLHAEAAVLFPRLSMIAGLEDVLVRSRNDHVRIEAVALTLSKANLTPSEWLRALRRLELELGELIEREEADVYPIARRVVPLAESHALALALRDVEDRELDGPRR